MGDKLVLADDEVKIVRAFRITQNQGAYAPFTASGIVIVNGVKASSFIAVQESETQKAAGIDTGLALQFLAYAFEMPHRMWFQYLSACTEEHYATEGISLSADPPHKLFRWFLAQHYIAMALLSFPLLALFACLAHPVATLVVTLGAIIVAALRTKCFSCSTLKYVRDTTEAAGKL